MTKEANKKYMTMKTRAPQKHRSKPTPTTNTTITYHPSLLSNSQRPILYEPDSGTSLTKDPCVWCLRLHPHVVDHGGGGIPVLVYAKVVLFFAVDRVGGIKGTRSVLMMMTLMLRCWGVICETIMTHRGRYIV